MWSASITKSSRGPTYKKTKMLYKEEGDQKSRCTQIQGPWFFLEWFKSLSINYRPLSSASYHKQHYRNWTKQYSGPNNPVNCTDISTPCCCVWPGYSDLKKKIQQHKTKKTQYKSSIQTNNKYFCFKQHALSFLVSFLLSVELMPQVIPHNDDTKTFAVQNDIGFL